MIALGILLAGFLALRILPIEQYPDIAPPSLALAVVYPGADAATLDQNVTQVIEQEMNGVDGFLYMASTSRSNGTATITLTFEAGTSLDAAQVDVQNRLNRVESRLPEEVRRQGINITEANSGFLMVVALTSKSGDSDSVELGNVASNSIIDELRRVPGVGDIVLFGSPYAMRIWLDPDKLATYNLSPSEALLAVQEQNSQTAGGAIGDQPNAKGNEINATIVTQNRFTKPEQFQNIILKANPDGSTVTLADVGRVELGAQNFLQNAELNGKPTAGMAVQLRTGANALSTADGIRERMTELAKGLPGDVTWSIPYDTSPFVAISVEEVIKTLIEAMVLVFLVMLLFLQNWRATVIATIVVPIALAGACVGLPLFGFSINVLSLLAMVLAIGILVDDAIVVIENVERIMAEEHLGPREAAIKAMAQIKTAIIGITLVLIAVFVPMAFFPGSTGGIYRQFSVTLAVSIAFSALLAFTLTPALCATLLKPHAESDEDPPKSWLARRVPLVDRASGYLGRFSTGFNTGFSRTTDRYQRGVGKMIAAPLRWLAVFAALVVLVGFLFARIPGGFLPNEDQGYVVTVIQAPPGATQQRTDLAMRAAQNFYTQQPQIEGVLAIRGFSFFGQGQSAAMIFATMHPWDERKGKDNSSETLAGKALGTLGAVKDAMIFTLSPPPIQALGNATGFSFRLQATGGQTEEALTNARNMLLGLAAQSPVLANVRPEGLETAPQLQVDIDRVKVRALGLAIGDVNSTLSIATGSAYANDFNYEGRVRRVYMQADAPYRMTPADILNLRVRNTGGEMVPFGSFTTARWSAGSPQLQRYNGYAAAYIAGESKPGKSSGDALTEMEALFKKLASGFAFEWTGTAFEEKQAGGQIGALLGLSLLIAFLVSCALYESWTVPIAVLLVVPLGVLGSVLLSMARGYPADIYFNVGLIAIIGLAAKNAILIVEFAIEEEVKGKSVVDATLSAVKLRLRPIIMTSLAFILGMVPLFISTGAGSASRRAVGTGVMGGMISATLLGIFMTPVFYIAVRRWLTRKQPHAGNADIAERPTATAATNARMGKHSMHKLIFPLAAAALLAGCNFAPKHITPELSTPLAYPPEVSPSGARIDAVAIDWHDFFQDERLRALIAMALANNRDLRIAVARIDEAKGQYRITRSDQLPKLDGSASYTRNRVGTASINPAQGGAVTGGAAGVGQTPDGFVFNDYQVGVAVTSFEIDFWGRVRNLSEAARAQYLGTVAAERAFRLSLIRDLATAYLTSRSLAEQADQADQAIVSRERGLKIAKIRLDAGVTSALDYRQSETLVTQAQTQAATLRNQRAQQRNIVRLLVGTPIDEDTLAPARTLGNQNLLRDIDAGLPSALLANRPDIIEAGENLRAARANIGAARAAFFPTISLTGQFGFASTDLDNLFSSAGKAWSFGPSLSLPIFDWGERKGNLDVARARQTIQVATYERTVQTAFREVSDALADRRYLAEQIVSQTREVVANRALSQLAQTRYDNGVTDFLQVLDARRNLFSAEQALIQLRGQELNSNVTLYAALGGGLGPSPILRRGNAAPPPLP